METNIIYSCLLTIQFGIFLSLVLINRKRTKNIQKSIILTVLILLLIIAPAGAELDVVLEKLSPQPVEPGQDLLMSVMLVNENGEVDDTNLTILPDSPILLKNDKDRVINIGKIIKYGAYAETYRLHIDPGAASGIYEIELRLYWSSSGQPRETRKVFNITVKGMPQLVISNININPELITPQDTFNLSINVSNEGTGAASEVQINAVTEGLPFVPVDADTKIIKQLNPGETRQFNYKIMVKDKTEISSYSIPIKMDYKNEDGTKISLQNLVGIKILGKAKLSIANIKTEPQNPVKDDPVTLTIRIENSGTGDAKSVRVSLNSSFSGTKTAFLGKIKPNDDAPCVFTFYADEGGDIPYSVTIEFEDDLGQHTMTETLKQYIRVDKSDTMALFITAVLTFGSVALYLSQKRIKR